MLRRGVLERLRRRFGQPSSGGVTPAVGEVRFGSLRRTTPISLEWGYDRGRPVDRYYIEEFLEEHATRIRGRVLEVGDNAYTRRFGGDLVTISDVLHVREGAQGATVIADLERAEHVPSDLFDCLVLTQTLQLVYDTRAAVATLHRILKPGGALLATVPGISQIDRYEWHDAWCWSFTPTSIARLLEERFRSEDVTVRPYGNVLVATAFLYGLCAEELERSELDSLDPHYPLVISACAIKAGE